MAGPQTDKTGQIQPRNGEGTKAPDLAELVRRLTPAIAAALPKHVTADRMCRMVLTALRSNAKLATCSPASFLGCVMIASQLGLEVNTPMGQAFLIPRMNRKRKPPQMECTLLIGYQGMLDLARRSGQVLGVFAHAVREGDVFHYELGLEPTIKHVPSEHVDRESRPITHVYAVARLRDGDPIFEVLPLSKVLARRDRSQAAGDGPWVTDFEAMARKTGVRALYTWLPKSTEMSTALGADTAAEANAAPLALLDEKATKALADVNVFVAPDDASDAIDTDGESVVVPDETANA